MVSTREKDDTSNKNHEDVFFTCEKNDTSNHKPRRFAPKFPPFIGTCSLQRRFADILEEFFCNKSGKHLGNWRRIVSFVSWSTKKTVVIIF